MADISFLAIIIVLAITIIVSFNMYNIIQYLNYIVDVKGKITPSFECTKWLNDRKDKYLDLKHKKCVAVEKAIEDSQLPENLLICPTKKTPPEARFQDPYIFYINSQDC
jgi:hypothetical protein